MVKGGGGLGEGFKREGDGEESPQLARIGLRAEGSIGGGERGEKDDGEIERVGEEQTSCWVARGDEVKKLERRYE